MKTSKLVLIIFLLLGISFIVGSFFDIPVLYKVANYLMVPVLLLHYRSRTRHFFWPVVVILICFYLRDLFIMYDLKSYMPWVMIFFVIGMIIWYLCAFTGFRRSRIHTVETISLVIMFCFLTFLTYSMSEMVSEVIPAYEMEAYVYILMLTVLLGLTFTKYLLKSHWASLWLMVSSAALLVSEISLFFRLYVIEDISVNLFFPVFHVFMFYCLVKYALNKRKTGKLPGF